GSARPPVILRTMIESAQCSVPGIGTRNWYHVGSPPSTTKPASAGQRYVTRCTNGDAVPTSGDGVREGSMRRGVGDAAVGDADSDGPVMPTGAGGGGWRVSVIAPSATARAAARASRRMDGIWIPPGSGPGRRRD